MRCHSPADSIAQFLGRNPTTGDCRCAEYEAVQSGPSGLLQIGSRINKGVSEERTYFHSLLRLGLGSASAC